MAHFKDLVRLSVLEAVRPELLLSFLRPFSAYCEARGVPLDETALDDAWRRRLHDVLNDCDPSAPAALQQALVDVGDVVDVYGHDELLRVAEERQLELFRPDERLNPCELAFRAYVQHRDVFEATHLRTQSRETRQFVEFFAAQPLAIAKLTSRGLGTILAEHLGRWFAARNRTEFCEVVATESRGELDGDVCFRVLHGRPPRTHGIIADGLRSRLSYVPDKEDLAVYDKGAGKLSVNAQFPGEQDLYRRLIGRVYFGSEEYFSVVEAYTGEPLREHGAAALSVVGIPGLARVTLRALRGANLDGTRFDLSADDLAPQLGNPLLRSMLATAEIRSMKFALDIYGRKRPLLVEVATPNHLKFDRRAGAEIVREFLLERGFMRLPVQTPRLVATAAS